MVSERQVIKRVARTLRSAPAPDLRLGLGDDAAILQPDSRAEWVITTDAFLEGLHFLPKLHPPHAAGYKALARATSDIAAMGARPRYFLLTLALPAARAGKWLDPFLAGMSRAARRFGLVLVGGDTTQFQKIVVNVTVLGEVAPGGALLRSNAHHGDLICVSGKLGQAGLGLELLRRGKRGTGIRTHGQKLALQKQLYPEPRLALGQYLSANRMATAAIDLSDGLSTDLAHLCEASGVGARIWERRNPVVDVPGPLRKLGFDPLGLALNGGDDYELLFTVSPWMAARLPAKIAGVPITIIGEIARDNQILLIGAAGQARQIPEGGWDPFSRKGKAKLAARAAKG